MRLTIPRIIAGLEVIEQEARDVGSDLADQIRSVIDSLNTLVECGVYDADDTIVEIV